ncbi:hypothetical protein BDV12DRAFT_61103 [Aspergillus spectabilis]
MSAFTSTSLRSMLRAAPCVATPARSFGSSQSRSYARLTITGRLGSEPEVRPSSGGDLIRYTIASKSSGARDNQGVDWFRVSSFVQGPQRDFILGLQKGTLVCVDAEASWRTFTDSEGKESPYLAITQRHIEVLKRPFNQESNQETNSRINDPLE